MRVAHNKKALPESAFKRTQPSLVTEMSSAEYMALLRAAREKGKIDSFYKWQRNRKIILKG